MEKLETRTVYKTRGEQTAWHRHPYWEILCFQFGAGMIKVGDEIAQFKGGDAVMIPADVFHALDYRETTQILCVYGPLPPNAQRKHYY